MKDVVKAHATQKAWVVDVNMGYGHSRAAHALKDLSLGHVLSANDYPEIPSSDLRLWKQSRELYEFFSRLKPLPFIGDPLFHLFDQFQAIEPFYPRRDLSEPSLQVKQIYRMIQKGMGRHLIATLAKNPLPFVSTFFIPAFFADYYDYPGDIWCVTTDADISRAWVPLDPKKSRIKYLASTGRVVERLKLYGVRPEQIYHSGFPLPKELIGGSSSKIVKDLLAERLGRLDPNGIFTNLHAKTLEQELGSARCSFTTRDEPITLTFTVGGAGAQRQLGAQILVSLAKQIAQEKIRLNLVAGLRKETVVYFHEVVASLGLNNQLGKHICVPEFVSRDAYFSGFNALMEKTDILWTKPSELSFYTGVGLAVIMAPPIGSQELFNQTWLEYMGGGIRQEDPRYTHEWLFDWVQSGGLARMAWNGYAQAPTHGTYRIEDIVCGKKNSMHQLPYIV